MAGPLSTDGTEAARESFQQCVWSLACGQLLSSVEKGLDVDTGWIGIITQDTVSEMWDGICQQVYDSVGGA